MAISFGSYPRAFGHWRFSFCISPARDDFPKETASQPFSISSTTRILLDRSPKMTGKYQSPAGEISVSTGVSAPAFKRAEGVIV